MRDALRDAALLTAAYVGFQLAPATLGTVPFAMLGGQLAGPRGVIVGVGIGSLSFGRLAAFLAAFRKSAHSKRRSWSPSA